MTNTDVYSNFAATGDWMRTSKPDLENVINSGVRTLIFDGDADYILNFNGVEALVRNSRYCLYCVFLIIFCFPTAGR